MGTELRIEGAAQFANLARDLRAAGDDGKGLRLALLKQLRIIAAPIKADVQRNAFNIPVKGPRSTGLRVALMRATRTTISMAGRMASLRVIVDPSKMPSGGEGKWVAGSGQQGLPTLMEGIRPWRKPLFGDKDHWYPQPSHSFIGPAARAHQADATVAAAAAVAETVALLAKGNNAKWY